MENIKKIYVDYFNNYVFKDTFGDYELILIDFLEHVESLSLSNKIRLCCIDNSLNKNELSVIDGDKPESTFKNLITRLNKSLDLKVNSKNGLNYYKSTKKSIKKINMEIFNFISINKYISNHKMTHDVCNDKEIIILINNMFNEEFREDLHQLMDNDTYFYEIDYSEICLYDIKLEQYLYEKPQDFLALMEIVLKDLISTDTIKNIKVGLKNLPTNLHLNIGDHRVEHLNNLFQFEGIIKRKTDINPKLKSLVYLCSNPDCVFANDKLKITAVDDIITPLKCCPRCKAPLDLVEEEIVDNMFMILEEDYSTSNKTDSNLSKINLCIQNELIQPMREKNYIPGDKVKVIGYLEKIKTDKLNYKTFVNVINVIASENTSNVELSKLDIEEIKEFSKNENVFNIIKDNFISEIKGYDNIKKSLILQLVGASSNHKGQRADTHILLVGEPGVAKTKLAEYYSKYASRVVYTSGTNTSKAGLTGACIKDEFTGDWAVEAGSLPKANGGIAVIDELDKMSREDSQVMHDALESQIVPIRKAISIDLICKCSVLACANPKYGYFDKSKSIVEQISLVPSLLNRFDLIYILKDEVDQEKDYKVFNHILDSWNGENNSDIKRELSLDFMKKYFHYCKFYNKPGISKSAQKYIVKFTQNLRNKNQDSMMKFNARQLNGIVRLALAHAKLLFKKNVDIESMSFAAKQYNICLKDLGVGFHEEAMKAEFQITRKEIIDIIMSSNGVTIKDILEKLPNLTEEIIEKEIKILKNSGDIFEPRKGELRGITK